MDKLKLEQDVTGEEKGDSSKKKKDVARLLKVDILLHFLAVKQLILYYYVKEICV